MRCCALTLCKVSLWREGRALCTIALHVLWQFRGEDHPMMHECMACRCWRMGWT